MCNDQISVNPDSNTAGRVSLKWTHHCISKSLQCHGFLPVLSALLAEVRQAEARNYDNPLGLQSIQAAARALEEARQGYLTA